METNILRSVRAQKTAAIAAIAALLVISVTTVVVVYDMPAYSNGDQNQQTTVETTDSEVQTTAMAGTATRPPTPTIRSTPIPTATPSPTPTLSPTVTPSLTATATPTSGPYDNEKYVEFVENVYGEAEVDTDIPLRMRGVSVVEGKVLVVVMNLSAPSGDLQRVRQVNILITSGYAQAVANYDNGLVDGKIPNRLRIAEVNNTGHPPKTLYVNTSLAREYYTGQIDAMEFTDRYWSTKRNQTASGKESTRIIDRKSSNITLYNESAG